MATLETGGNNAESSGREISFQLQTRDLPSRRLLGKGLSGIGYETAWKGARYARKDFVGVQRDIFLQEAAVLVGLKDHKNIVKTYGWTVDKRSCSLVLEYMDDDLLSLLQKRLESKQGLAGEDLGKQSSTSTSTLPFDLPEAVDMMLQIASGMEYLHEQGIVHGDLKTKNILVTYRKDGDQSSKVVKVADFGLVWTKRKSKFIVSAQVRKLDLVRWKAPEYLKTLSRRLNLSNNDEDETSSESESESTPNSVLEVSSTPPVVNAVNVFAADVYSFGVTCSQIMTGNSPYPDLDWKELMVKKFSGLRPNLPDACHPLLRDLLISCWGDPAERPSFSAIRMRLTQVQRLLTTAMGKRPQEAAAPSVAESPANQSAVVASREVSTCSGSSLPPQPSNGAAIIPSASTMCPSSVATVAGSVRSNSPGTPWAASPAPSPPAAAAAPPVADDSSVGIWRLVGIVPSSEPAQSEDIFRFLEQASPRDSIAAERVASNSRLEDMRFMTRVQIESTGLFSAEHSKPSLSTRSDVDNDVDEELAPESKDTNIFTSSLLPGTSSYLNTRSISSTSNLSYLESDTRWSEGSDIRWSCDEPATTSVDLITGPTMSSIERGSNLEGSSFESGSVQRAVEASQADGGTPVMDAHELEHFCGDNSKAVMLTDERGTVLWANSAFQRLTKERMSSRTQATGLHIDPLGIRTHLATLTFQPPFPASKCKAVMWGFLKKFITHEDGTFRICDASVCSPELRTTGSLGAGNARVPVAAFLPQAFKAWRDTRVLAPTQRKREERKNQWLLRRCFEMVRQIFNLQQDLQQEIQTHGVASQNISSQGPQRMSSSKTKILSDIGIEHDPYDEVIHDNVLSVPLHGGHDARYEKAAVSHVMAERDRRMKQKENFAALRRLVPPSQKSDKASILGDAIVHLQDLQDHIVELEAGKMQIESQYEKLKFSHQELEHRNKQLEAAMGPVQEEMEDRGS